MPDFEDDVTRYLQTRGLTYTEARNVVDNAEGTLEAEYQNWLRRRHPLRALWSDLKRHWHA